VSENIFRYFPSLTGNQKEQLSRLEQIYTRWNSVINLISRKDMDNFMVHHVLHSMALANVISFAPGTTIMDVGTGGGFPGIPLAIMFPDVMFTLIDSIEKKIKVVTAVVDELDLKNVRPLRKRVEEEKGEYHYIVSRAVTDFPEFVRMTLKNLAKSEINVAKNGIIYLKGGDLSTERSRYKDKLTIWDIKDFFTEPYFDTKKILYLVP
jgi:16S rRNA (guanine527-N7)-methyltransferase